MKMVLLFTYGMSLASWRRQGLIDRELSYLRHLLRAGVSSIALFTYSPDDLSHRSDADGFEVLPRPWWLGYLVYSLFGPLLRRRAFHDAHIIRSNQSRGAWTGIIAKRLGHPGLFVVRCGWVRTRQMMTVDEQRRGMWLWWAEYVEQLTFASADLIFVTSSADRSYLLTTYQVRETKVQIMPNSVDTALFIPPAGGRSGTPRRVITVGRLVEMKNFQALISAVAGLETIELVIVGDGPFRPALEQLARETGTPVVFRPFMPNSALPQEFAAADVFVMPQLYGAGMSKVILEAMASGLIVIASDIELHRSVIDHGVNGWLCGTSEADLREALSRVLSLDAASRAAMAARARGDVEQRYAMSAVAAREMACYRAFFAGRSAAAAVTP